MNACRRATRADQSRGAPGPGPPTQLPLRRAIPGLSHFARPITAEPALPAPPWPTPRKKSARGSARLALAAFCRCGQTFGPALRCCGQGSNWEARRQGPGGPVLTASPRATQQPPCRRAAAVGRRARSQQGGGTGKECAVGPRPSPEGWVVWQPRARRRVPPASKQRCISQHIGAARPPPH